MKVLSNQSESNYHINQDYFKVWSHDMAYIFGLWFADGYIYGGQMFDITVKAKDKYILKRIAERLNYSRSLYDEVNRQVARINFSCPVIYNDLLILNGGTEQKNKFPDIPDVYMHDFIRGYFDGSGSKISLVRNKRINCTFEGRSKQFREKLLEILKTEAGVTSGSFDQINRVLKFGTRDTIKIGKYLYRDNPELFLLRKKKKFNISKQEEI